MMLEWWSRDKKENKKEFREECFQKKGHSVFVLGVQVGNRAMFSDLQYLIVYRGVCIIVYF